MLQWILAQSSNSPRPHKRIEGFRAEKMTDNVERRFQLYCGSNHTQCGWLAMRAYRRGGWPTCRLNAVLKVLAELYPTRSATSSIPRSWRRSRSFATAMRQARRYSIGGNPTVRVKRSKNDELDSAAVLAS